MRVGALSIAEIPASLAETPFADLHRCTRFEFSDDNVSRTAVIEMSADDGTSLTLRLLGIHKLRLPEIANQFWLPELEIASVADRGWEGVRFMVVSPAGDNPELLCYCRDIEYVAHSSSETKTVA